MKLQCELYPSRDVALCLDPYCGLGFALWCLSSVYSGHHSYLIPPAEVEINRYPALWLSLVSQQKGWFKNCAQGQPKLHQAKSCPWWHSNSQPTSSRSESFGSLLE